ncbi:hypothetical protein M422DRAFT_31796 [Sphaerobolus stellatus SS14]|uniref:Uncharacterized protein n=1 Tax=Sphaerobolus stellatus (strain SS14) TaxID=990650 RepID=A0A0C9VI75_SPHS4|nr:hypothetical protein M422DRAFT_31796 [Sphaerobolus stellatus SS14]
MSKRKPSEILLSLVESLPPDTFLGILSKKLYPVLDCLSDSQPVQYPQITERIGTVNYEGMKVQLTEQINALYKHVRRDWDGWELQEEMMDEIVGDLCSWLPILWTVGVEDGVEMALIHKSLRLCYSIAGKLYDSNSKSDFGDRDCQDVTILDEDEKKVYYSCGGLYTTIAWVWGELPLSVLMIDDIKDLGFMKDAEQFLRDDVETKPLNGDPFYDEHWNEKFWNVAIQLKKLVVDRRLLEFEANPSYSVFRRERQKDILKLVEIMDRKPHQTAEFGRVKRDVVLHPMKQPRYRPQSRRMLEASILSRETVILEEMHEAFPDLDEGYDFIQEKIDNRSSQFVAKARQNVEDDPVEESCWQQSMEGLEEDNSDYEQMIEDLCPDLPGPFEA